MPDRLTDAVLAPSHRYAMSIHLEAGWYRIDGQVVELQAPKSIRVQHTVDCWNGHEWEQLYWFSDGSLSGTPPELRLSNLDLSPGITTEFDDLTVVESPLTDGDFEPAPDVTDWVPGERRGLSKHR